MRALPPHFRIRAAAGGRYRYSWDPAPALARAGWPTVPLGLSGQRTQAEAEDLANQINALVAKWRAGEIKKVPSVILDLKLVARPGKAEGRRLMRASAPPGTCAHLIDQYLASRRFSRLAKNTQISYRSDAEFLREWCGDQPLASITPKMVKRLYETLFDGVPATKTSPAKPGVPRRAQKIVIMGRTIWKWGKSEDMVTGNPFMIETETPEPEVPVLWTDEAVRVFVRTADEMDLHSIGTAVLLNCWMGQRVADVRAWDRRNMRDGVLVVVQQKTKERVELPLGLVPELTARLQDDDARNRARGINTTKLVHDADGRAYSEAGFRAAFNRVRDQATSFLPLIAQLDMMHLRHTAITRMADAGATTSQIRAVSGHTLASVEQVLKRYNLRTRKQAADAFLLVMKANGK